MSISRRKAAWQMWGQKASIWSFVAVVASCSTSSMHFATSSFITLTHCVHNLIAHTLSGGSILLAAQFPIWHLVAVVVVIVDVDDEEGEGGGEDAQRRMLCTMQSFFDIHMALSLHPHCRYESSSCVSTTEVVSTQMQVY